MPLSANTRRTSSGTRPEQLRIRRFGSIHYASSLRAMRYYSRHRTDSSDDTVWLLEHLPVLTLGVRAEREQILQGNRCPVIRSDRGGQTTYHGPGQLVGYLMLNLKRLDIGVRSLVTQTEKMLQLLLAEYGLQGELWRGRPGIYVEGKKIASLGFRIHRHFSYHGFSLNVSCDLEPFSHFHPCGIAGQPVTRLSDHAATDMDDVCLRIGPHLHRCFCG